MRGLRRRFAFWFTNRFVPIAYRPLNPIAVRVLESRVHWLLSWYVAVVRFEGRRTGRTYAVPFTYARVDERTFECTTNRRAVWWRNLIGGRQASFLFKGRWHEARAEAIVEPSYIEGALRRRDRLRAWIVDVPVEETAVVRVTVG
jgi:hypothetical protein